MQQLSTLVRDLTNYQTTGNLDVGVRQITSDSRQVAPGSLFVAVSGLTVDGHHFIPQTLQQGASAIVGQADPQDFDLRGTTYLRVADSREALGQIASTWYGNPSRKLEVIGVTGTDGKTTTSTLIHHLLTQAGLKAGLVTTVKAIIGSKNYDTGFHVTNPDPIPLQSYLSEMVEAGCNYAVLEVTSHGLDQQRVAGTDFKMAVLTNITHEHLDYHLTFDNYVAAKGRLFAQVQVAFLNQDNQSADLMRPHLSSSAKVIFYSPSQLSPKLLAAVQERFPEIYNQENAAAAIAVASHLNLDQSQIIAAIKNFPGIEGRLELLSKSPDIYVDFAHTPNALKNVLTILKQKLRPKGRLIAVFGCAGERDIQKRPLMGKISTQLADLSIFTAEDPRSENIDDIFEQMVVGANQNPSPHQFRLIADRKSAIEEAIKAAGQHDIVVICGKGHEKSINLGHGEVPWSDQQVAKQILKSSVKST